MDKPMFQFLILQLLIIPSTLRLVYGLLLSCNQTPYPQTCSSFLRDTKTTMANETEVSFRDIFLKIILEQALEAHRAVSLMDFSSLDELAKKAWEDCLELYENSLHQLNETIVFSPSISATLDDVQTYLSAAITNHETCKNGFVELNLHSHLESFPSILTDFSKLLSSALAINKLSSHSSKHFSRKQGSVGGHRRLLANEFPPWVTSIDRKLLHSSTPPTKPDLVVAKDGTGGYKTVSEAIAASTKIRRGTKRLIIYIKSGIYKENVVVTNKMKNLMLIGDGIDKTIITSDKNVQSGYTTFRSATVGVSGDGFVARGITFQNTAGPQKHQAVAIRSGSDFAVFYQCSFKGYQDTLYVYSKRQFFKNCDIYGTVDFIFGDAAVVLQSCNIYVRKPMSNQMNTITAQGRSDPNENTGIVIHDSIIQAAPDLKIVQGSFRTFLGRPWKEYSRTLVIKTMIDRLVDRNGWTPWSGGFGLQTLYYGEYMNTGPGASTSGRVKWPGYHLISNPAVAAKFSVGEFLAGNNWIPATGVPFTSGL